MSTNQTNLDFDFDFPEVEDPVLATKDEAEAPTKNAPRKTRGKKGGTDPEEAVQSEANEDEVSGVEGEEQELPKYSQDELLAVFDEILFKGEYRETVQIGRKLKVVFRSRSASEMATISRTLDGMNFQLISTLEDQRVLQTLAYSLEEYNGRSLSDLKPVPGRYQFIGKLPAAIIGLLMEKLAEFDRKVFLAVEEAGKNF